MMRQARAILALITMMAAAGCGIDGERRPGAGDSRRNRRAGRSGHGRGWSRRGRAADRGGHGASANPHSHGANGHPPADNPSDADAQPDGDSGAHGNSGPDGAGHVPNHNSRTRACPAANASSAGS